MARTRGAKSSSPSRRKKSLRKESVPDPVSESPQPRVVSPPVKPAPPKPPARRYLTRSGGRPLQKRPRVESSEPIDLTEQSPEPSPVPTPVPSPIPLQVPSPASPAEPKEPQPPLPEPQIPSEIAPKEIIRRPMHWTQRRGVLLEALFKMSERYFFGPHHLILAALLYFEEKLERKRICRELFILDKWNNMTTYRVDQPERPQPAARRASPRHIPEGITVATPTIPRAPSVAPASSQPSTSAEPRMVIPISEYRELCRSLETLTASQSSLASRDGSHSSMPRVDVGHSGPIHCHLKAAPASFRPATSC
uniref:Uncharacterized protein n=1 Tax=Vitis vinifera TaxID=29760 RepID=A5BD89_VITVI|nr:hypothetical protein VITISV_034186 [Vitis vinifera]